MSIKERLIKFLEIKKISKSEFGRRIGVSSAFITSMRKSMQPDKIQRIASEFPDLNTSWLLTGEGEMLKSAAAPSVAPAAASPAKSDDLVIKALTDTIATFRDTFATMRETIATLKEQLAVKDEQIRAILSMKEHLTGDFTDVRIGDGKNPPPRKKRRKIVYISELGECVAINLNDKVN